MGILDKYNKRIGIGTPLQGSTNTGLIFDPSSPQQLIPDLEDKYDNAIGIDSPLQGNINTGLIYDPSAPQQIPQDTVTDFNKTSLDLENPQPLGGPINVPYTTKVGSEIKTSPTTQPYTPQNTYSDSFTSPELKSRTIDPIK